MAELLRVEGVSKFFPGVKALENVDFSVNSGEVVALLGAKVSENQRLSKQSLGFIHATQEISIWTVSLLTFSRLRKEKELEFLIFIRN